MYVEESDVTDDGTLTISGCDSKPVVVFVTSDYCGYCRQVKPTFEEFCRLYSNYCICVKADVNEERGRAFLRKIGYTVSGVPDFLKFVNCKRVNQRIAGRNLNNFVDFIR